MRTPWIWSVSLGRWWNAHVRVHMLFFLFVVFVLYLTSQFPRAPHWLGVGVPVAFFLSVLLHEITQVVVARRLGGVDEDIVIAPLGGLSPVRVPYEPHSELVALMSGILAHAAVCFLCSIGIGVLSPEYPLVQLLQPTFAFLRFDDPQALLFSDVSVLKMVFWVNWSLILVNLLPVFPFDGGYALHAVTTFLWPEFESRQSHTAICRLGKVLSAVALIAAWFTFEPSMETNAQPPAWVALMLLSAYVFFNSRREEVQQFEVEKDDDSVFGYDFSQGYTSLERSVSEDGAHERVAPSNEMGFVGKWLERRREVQRQREIEQEADDERRVDEVLQRLHEQGMRSLSADDRALLNRVSERYRSRQD